MKLYLIRHPEPMIESGVCYGVTDVPAKAEALVKCVSTLKPTLAELNGITIYTSPLQRCALLAASINGFLPASKRVISSNLSELDFGRWEGQSWDAIYANDAQGLDAWAAQPISYAPGGGESLAQLRQRVTLWLNQCLTTGEQQAIVVTHGGPLRVLLGLREVGVKNSSPEDALATSAPPWGSLNTIEITL